MLYFSHLDQCRCASMESPNKTVQPNGSHRSPILPDELLPFGFFLSQLIYSSGWLFSENRLPGWLQTLAVRLETPESEVDETSETNTRNHGRI